MKNKDPAWDASRLRAEMAARRISGRVLAGLIEKHENTVHSYTSERVAPTVAVLADIALALGCTVRDLLAKEDR